MLGGAFYGFQSNGNDTYRNWSIAWPAQLRGTPSLAFSGGNASPADSGTTSNALTANQSVGNTTGAYYFTGVTAAADL